MGVTEVFAYASVHAHLNLAGWVTLAIIGLIYRAYPQAAQSKLAAWHYWLHNIGLPIMQGSLFLMILTGKGPFVAGAIAGSLVLGLGIVLFAINVWKHVGE